MGDLFLQWMMFVVLMALGQFSPGPDMILLTRVSLANGFKAGCATASGIATGLTIHAGIALCLVDRLSFLSKEGGGGNALILGLTILAMLYLSWLSYCLLVSAFVGYYSASKLELKEEEMFPSSILQSYRRGLLCNLLNPKVAIFLAGVVLPFQQMTTGSFTWLSILWLTIVLEGLLLWCVWVRLLQTIAIKKWYEKHFHWIDGVFGLSLLAIVIVLSSEAWTLMS